MRALGYAMGVAWGALGRAGRLLLVLLLVGGGWWLLRPAGLPPPDMSDPDAVPRYLEAQAAAQAASREAALSPQEREEQAAEAARLAAAEQAREAAIERAGRGLDKLPWWTLCERWGRAARRNTVAPETQALERRLGSALKHADVVNVYAREKLPVVGMSGCGAMALLGQPDDQNATTYAAHTRVQHVWSSRRIYVYTEGPPGDHNGTVTAVQY